MVGSGAAPQARLTYLGTVGARVSARLCDRGCGPGRTKIAACTVATAQRVDFSSAAAIATHWAKDPGPTRAKAACSTRGLTNEETVCAQGGIGSRGCGHRSRGALRAVRGRGRAGDGCTQATCATSTEVACHGIHSSVVHSLAYKQYHVPAWFTTTYQHGTQYRVWTVPSPTKSVQEGKAVAAPTHNSSPVDMALPLTSSLHLRSLAWRSAPQGPQSVLHFVVDSTCNKQETEHYQHQHVMICTP
jgi:hypothetical protein